MNLTQNIRTSLRWALMLVALPAALLVAGCDDDDDSVDTDQSPNASFTASTNGLTVSVDASGSEDPDGGALDYSWDFGDDETASTETATHTYESAGEYAIELTVTDDENETDSQSQTVTVSMTGDGGVASVNYDTTMISGVQTIVIDETDANEGILPVDGDGNSLSDDNSVTWNPEYEYLLRGRVFVNEGQTLNIMPGTVIRGTSDADPLNTGTLVVARGGMINADGTQDDPIIFTAEGDNSPDGTFNVNYGNRGNWGGVLLLGRAPNNTDTESNTIEGLADEPRAQYGGNVEDDNSGTLRYVSIRYGGSQINPGNEINGLTMGSVGSGTTIEYVEVVSNLDDGFEWFGGTVNGRYLVATFVGDDSFDIDQGYNGSLQYLLAVQGFNGGERGGEHDSGDQDLGGEDSQPVARPTICNATYIGRPNGDVALELRDNFGGSYYKSIFANFPAGIVSIEDLDSGADSRNEFEMENLRIENNIGIGFGDTITDNEGDFGDTVASYLQDNNTLLDMLNGFNVAFEDGEVTALDLFPSADSEAYNDVDDDDANCLEETDFIGAFGSGDNWAQGWTAISQSGLLGDN